MRADLCRDGAEPVRGVLASMGRRAAGLVLHLDDDGRPAFDLRTFDIARLALRGDGAVGGGEHSVEVVFGYDGGGRARGADVALLLDGEQVAAGRIAVTPPALFSLDETFDIGRSTGSAVGPYRSPHPFTGGRLHRVVVERG